MLATELATDIGPQFPFFQNRKPSAGHTIQPVLSSLQQVADAG